MWSKYTIKVNGHLDQVHWVRWFEGMEMIFEADGNTVLVGEVADQAALHGLLNKIRDLGLDLLALERLEDEENEVKE